MPTPVSHTSDHFSAPAGSQQYASSRRIADGVRKEVLQNPSKQGGVGLDDHARSDDSQRQTALRGQGGKFDFEPGHQFADVEVTNFWTKRARVEGGYVEKLG